MRVLIIVGALLLGLIGLLMSLCGGGILILGIGSSPKQQIPGMLAITVPFILVGGLCLWGGVVILRKKLGERDPDR